MMTDEQSRILEAAFRRVQRIDANIKAGYREGVQADDADYARGDLLRTLREIFGPDPRATR